MKRGIPYKRKMRKPTEERKTFDQKQYRKDIYWEERTMPVDKYLKSNGRWKELEEIWESMFGDEN